MNILGKNINPETINKISQMMSDAQLNEIKRNLGNLDKNMLLKLLSEMNVNETDVKRVEDKIKNTPTEELLHEISRLLGRG